MRNTSSASGLHCQTLLLFFFILLLLSSCLARAADSITATNPLTFGKTITSSGDTFELGFFKLGTSSNWYVGIWYASIQPKIYVWVANRDRPIIHEGGALKIAEQGNLVLVDQANNAIWSSNQTKAEGTIAELLDSGNLVVRKIADSDKENYLWQSFDYPADTLLPGMKLGWDLKKGLNRILTSWRSVDDPSPGDSTFELGISGFPQMILKYRKNRIYRSGPWNGFSFSGTPGMRTTTSILRFTFVENKDEIYYAYYMKNRSLYSRLVLNPTGIAERYTWISLNNVWARYWSIPDDQCDNYGVCGAYGICDTSEMPKCKCITGFEPKNPRAWLLRDAFDGCVLKTRLNCRSDGFLPLRQIKLPDTSGSFLNRTMSLEDCERICRSNCSCTAYARSNFVGSSSGCFIWVTELLDIRLYGAVDDGQLIYVRVSASDLANSIESGNGSKKTGDITKVVVGITVVIFLLLVTLSIYFCRKRSAMKRTVDVGANSVTRQRSRDFLLRDAVISSCTKESGETSTDDEFDLPFFDFHTIAMATDNFSLENKLGEGGFGSVYKGMLIEGQEIAVKRLSKTSGQGIEEFKNEVRLIARLQHRNLVQLLGCCVDLGEKMLVYEYMENRSLDSILFDKEKCVLLNWEMRFNIICGIARGLLYLHQDSRFRIIHRDLKVSNILLDKEMNPKISDFGLARIFGRDQIEANTRRVVGTYGYMSPEYAMDGLFSIKSDVFSFGVLLLEIVSGEKNRRFYNADHHQHNLLGHAWRKWKEGKGAEIIDSAAGEPCSMEEATRCIQVGLLCVQDNAEDRPSMANVVLMLSKESTPLLQQPMNPGFSLGKRLLDTDSSSSNKPDDSCTANLVTVTALEGR